MTTNKPSWPVTGQASWAVGEQRTSGGPPPVETPPEPAPTGYTIEWVSTSVTPINETDVQFNIICSAEQVGLQYDWVIYSYGGGPTPTGSGFTSGTTTNITGVDVSNLNDGTLQAIVALYSATDFTKGQYVQTPGGITKASQFAPTGYSVLFDQRQVNEFNKAAMSFTCTDTGSNTGLTYTYSIESDAGGTPVTGSGTIAGATTQVTGLDLSGLADGTITLTFEITNNSGTGGDVYDTITKNNIPFDYTATYGLTPAVFADNDSAFYFIMSSEEENASYSIRVDSDQGGTTVTDSGTLSGATTNTANMDLSLLNDGTLTIGLTLTNSNGSGTEYTFTMPKQSDYTGTLDEIATDPIAAYSVARLLSAGYTGPLIRVRRSTDNVEQNFTYETTNWGLDTSAVSAFLGNAQGYICKIFDQSLNTRHVICPVATQQPEYQATTNGTGKPSAKCIDADQTYLAYDGGGTFVSGITQYGAVMLALETDESQFQNRTYGGFHNSETGNNGAIEVGKSSSASSGGNFYIRAEQRATGASGFFYIQDTGTGPLAQGERGVCSVLAFDNASTRTLDFRWNGASLDTETTNIGTTLEFDSFVFGSAGASGGQDVTNPNTADAYINEMLCYGTISQADLGTIESSTKTYYGY